MAKGFVYIASLSHSGSTLLDLLLGNHPKFVGLGEISKVLTLDAKEIDEHLHMACTCGARSEDCSFWGPLLSELKKFEASAPIRKYDALVDHFYSLYDSDTQIVDSSKYRRGLETIADMPNVELQVLHLFKDVRAFTTSHRKSTIPELEIGRLPILFSSEKFSEGLYSISIKNPIYLFWKWYLRNRAMQKFIAAKKLPSTNVSYDQLAQSPESVMQKLFSFLGFENPPTNLAPSKSQSHIFMGNPMIGDLEKMSKIRYDDRWKKNRDWKFAARIFPFIMAFNDKIVLR